MRLISVFLLLMFHASQSEAQTFSAFLSRINSAPNAERPAIVDSFLAAVPSFPFVESTNQVHFLYRGVATNATLAGDMNNWDPAVEPMNLINGTDLWYKSKTFEPDARLDYKFVLGGSNWILDPRNPFTIQGGFGPNSELRMPDYVPAPEVEFYPDFEHGTLRDSLFHSNNLGNNRRIRIYTPPGYEASGDCYPLLVVHDGIDYINLAHTERILDYLIHYNLIQPLVAVFVPPVNREPEYAGDQQVAFGRFITEELLPWIDSEYHTCSESERRATVGASNGANISLWLGVTYPHVFGLVGGQSPYVQPSIFDTLSARADLGLRFYGDIGTYDIPILMPLAENLLQILQNQNYPVSYQQLHEGHSWGNWRAHLDDCLIYFFPSAIPTGPETPSIPISAKLVQNFPNPFNPDTKLGIELDHRQSVELTVYDINGRSLDTLAHGVLDTGKYEFVFDGTGLSSGTYFARLIAGSNRQTIKMILLK